MRDSTGPAPQARALLVAAFATLGLFAAHHVYGAVRYATPWRHHAAVVAFWVGLALLTAFLVHRRRRDAPLGRLAGWALLVVAVAFPVLVVGLFEGLYNHVAKDVLFLSGAPPSLLASLFPPPRYELPDDVLFEVSGVLQVVPAAFAARAALRLARGLRGGAARDIHPGSASASRP